MNFTFNLSRSKSEQMEHPSDCPCGGKEAGKRKCPGAGCGHSIGVMAAAVTRAVPAVPAAAVTRAKYRLQQRCLYILLAAVVFTNWAALAGAFSTASDAVIAVLSSIGGAIAGASNSMGEFILLHFRSGLVWVSKVCFAMAGNSDEQDS